ncbi:S9 family peptidase [Alteromonas gilva]|uniref:Prolyl oligopeptidase family serine peptidase n=1 Tax=Alteromonas gilva TaxID=2987522 RepID=A0ABT5L443_9ALTE|nr:prolyl oligopeptidase family serine peptidase [Alteromonas gilva]MDC8831204.1 prolyl oligopeptidase family serine peptidase [Alteromonas gilva]
MQQIGLRSSVILGLGVIMTACSATDSNNTAAQSVAVETNQPPAIIQPAQPVNMGSVQGDSAITLEQIMADPKWLGRQPQNPAWSPDGSMMYARQQADTQLNDYYRVSASGESVKIAAGELHLYKADEQVTSRDGRYTAWKYQDSVFVKMPGGEVVRLTQGLPLEDLQFATDNRLMARHNDSIVAFDLTTGQQQVLLSWKFAKAPSANTPPKDFIAREQQNLIEYIKVQRQNREDRFMQTQQLREQSPAMAPEPVYFDDNDRLVAVKMAPNGKHAIIVTTAKGSRRDATDIMPHYIQEDGRIAAIDVRQRVADAEPVEQTSWLIDVAGATKHELSYKGLPGYNDDVLAEVKQENAAARGEEYTINRLPRAIGLLNSWSQRDASIRWHQDGTAVALLLEAWDNKDSWLVTVDLAAKKLVNQHRQHDDAWINYRHNQFGWLNNSHTLYYLSEQSGYSHLYIQQPGAAPQALTSGQYVVNNLTLTDNDDYFYFKANKKHPGIYEIYRVAVASGEHETLTQLNGMTDYVLSPDEQTLLLTHSTVTRPPELYSASVAGNEHPMQLTHTISDEFLAKPWVAPQVVAIPSSHTDEPIYARVYLPENYQQGEPRRAVVFNHGAGYLQNAHLGWSGYFREFMFHSFLVKQGYVVLDMDYRASAGYGRDWRTAIYRQMGTPELEDNRDGVNWLVANANVDRARVGTYGGSYGGFLTFMAMFNEPDLYQAGAALRPVSDWAHYNTGYTSNILNTPDVDPIAYRRSSPIYHAEGLQKPLLINAPMVDNNVFFVDVVRLVQRLIELEKTQFETAIYPVEPHGFVQPSSWLDEYRRIYALFEENL